jgi:hypothetical protein
MIDARHKDPGRVEPESVSERSEDDRLVGGVPPIDIEGRIRLRIAQSLGLGERRAKIHSGFSHSREDIVAGAVQDSMDVLESIGDKGFADHLDDRNPASHGGFIKNWDSAFACKVKNFLPMLGQQGLVAGDHGLARKDRLPNEREWGFDPSHQFDDDADIGVLYQVVGICREQLAGSRNLTRLLEIAHRDTQDFEASAKPLREEVSVGDEVFINPGADGAKARKADADRMTHVEPGSIRPAGEFPRENCASFASWRQGCSS